MSAGMRVLDVFPNCLVSLSWSQRTNLAMQFQVFDVYITHFRMNRLLPHKFRVNLNLAQRGQHLKFLLHLLLTIQHKRLHVEVPKIMRNRRIKLTRVIVQQPPLLWLRQHLCLTLQHSHDLVQTNVSLLNLFLSNQTQRRSLLVISDLLHMRVHHLAIEN